VLGSDSRSLAAADLNGDGVLDLIGDHNPFRNRDHGLWVLLGNGDGTFQSPIDFGPANVVGFAAADFNGDQILDLVGGSSDGPFIMLGNGDGTFQDALAVDAVGTLAGDFNGDGLIDLAFIDFRANSGYVALGNGDGTFQSRVVFPLNEGPFFLAVADL